MHRNPSTGHPKYHGKGNRSFEAAPGHSVSPQPTLKGNGERRIEKERQHDGSDEQLGEAPDVDMEKIGSTSYFSSAQSIEENERRLFSSARNLSAIQLRYCQFDSCEARDLFLRS